ncbi:hypothetical protein JCM33374_g5017 [Metschnikowia sp. JCM 33374]|nr:hypothetical protein JCM33374_g5017 [Metschnikowia sp. JCM 33374]
MEFGIEKHDVYNVDETGFAMGILSATRVITGSDSREDPVILQPGNREWVTAIECISAAGFALPPFIIMKGARLQKGWFNNVPPKWRLGVTENGWTNNEMALSWLENIFIPSTNNTRGLIVSYSSMGMAVI